MRDLDLRALERDPDPSARVDLLEARLRLGQVTRQGLEAGAVLGDPAALALARRQGWPSRFWDHPLAPGAWAEELRALLTSRPQPLPSFAYLGHRELDSRDVEAGAFLCWGPRGDFLTPLQFWGGCLLRTVEFHADWGTFPRGLSTPAAPAQAGDPGGEESAGARRLRHLLAGASLPAGLPALEDEPLVELLAPLQAWNDSAWVFAAGPWLVAYRWWTSA